MNSDMTSHSAGFGPGMEEQQQPLGGMPGGEGQEAGGVKGMASRAGEKLMDTAEQQKQAGAQYVVGMADAVRRAAGEFDQQMPSAARYIRMAADQMETMSDSLRRRDVGQMVSDVQSFARRQPAAFLGMSLLAGFAAVRFMRSAAPRGTDQGNDRGMDRMDRGVDGGMSDDGRYGRPGGMNG